MINLPEGIERIVLSSENIEKLWRLKNKVKHDNSFWSFLQLMQKDFAVFSADWGYLEVSNLIFGFKANCHGIFVGHSVFRSVDDIREVCLYTLKYYDIIRLECKVPTTSKSLPKLLEKIGFKKEGILRKGQYISEKKAIDVYIYSFLEEDYYG